MSEEMNILKFITSKSVKGLPLARQGLLLLSDLNKFKQESFSGSEVLELNEAKEAVIDLVKLLKERKDRVERFGSDSVMPLVVIAKSSTKDILFEENALVLFDIIEE